MKSQKYYIAHAIVIAIINQLEGNITSTKFDELVATVEKVLEPVEILQEPRTAKGSLD